MVSPDNPADPTPPVSRRTVARTAAWAAPAIILSTASPAFAASAEKVGGAILFDEAEYDITFGKTVTVTGALVPSAGTAVPGDLRLTATVSAGFSILSGPTVTGTTFTVTLSGPKSAASGTLTVSSTNHPSYLTGTVPVAQLAPGFIAKGYGLLPLADTWVETASSDEIRWFEPAAGMLAVAATQVSTATVLRPWLDLRFYLDNQNGTVENNFGNAPFGAITRTGGRPLKLGTVNITTESQVLALQANNGGALDAVSGVGTNIGNVSRSGPGWLVSSDADRAAFMPSTDQNGAKITQNNKIFAFLPSTLPRGAFGLIRIIHTVYDGGDRQAKLGFEIQYRYA
jgi:hypothetical protein